MPRPPLVLAFCVLTLTVACAADVPPEASQASEATAAVDASSEINAILDTYFQAVERIDLASFRSLLANSDEVSVVTPNGRLGSAADLEGFFKGLQDAYAELHLQRSNVAIQTEGTAAWVAFDWTLDGKFANGSPAAVSGWETQIYRKTADGWRIAHIHYSVPFVVPPAPQ